ncbi:hypothetical protein QTO34_005122 [Cnephaeus nilssonii]|uniref:Uncharacterized protein n=1 Tax=Cnephaeus nilssonii TaxID=3371016 RepID=A0AA40HNT2_CNENI|nr:hypothetical protein QTO34_005122 [Eptesicus nilssonii]
MALEAEQVQRMNQHTHLSWDMEQLSKAASRYLELEKEKQTLQGTGQEWWGASVACRNAASTGSEALQAQYEGAKEDQQRMEISLKKLSSQCEVLSREKENFEEENHNLRRQSQTLARRTGSF